MIGLAIRDHRVLMPSFPDAPLDLAEKVEAALLHQVPEVADQVCDSMLVVAVAPSLKFGDSLGGAHAMWSALSLMRPIGSARAKGRLPSFSVRRQ